MTKTICYDVETEAGRKALETVVTHQLRHEQKDKRIEFTYQVSAADPFIIAPVSRLTDIKLAFGTFAKRLIRKGEAFVYEGKLIHAKETEMVRNRDYFYQMSRGRGIDSLETGNATRFFNHSSQYYNFSDEQHGDKIVYIAIRDIHPGEQCLVNYGPDYNYPEGLVYLHPSDGYLTSEELIEQYHLKAQFITGTLKGKYFQTEYHISELIHRMLFNSSMEIPDTLKELIQVPLISLDKTLNTVKYITPLMVAAAIGHIRYVQWLLEQEELSEIDLQGMLDSEHDTALYYALCNKQAECADLLIQALSRRVHRAIELKDSELIFQARRRLTLQNQQNESPLHLAVRFNNDNVIVGLLQLFQILHKYAYLGQESDIERAKDPFQMIDQHGFCPLLSAISSNNLKAIQLFCEFIENHPWSIYNKNKKNDDFSEETKNILPYEKAFSCLQPQSFLAVVTLLKKSTNILDDKQCTIRFLQILRTIDYKAMVAVLSTGILDVREEEVMAAGGKKTSSAQPSRAKHVHFSSSVTLRQEDREGSDFEEPSFLTGPGPAPQDSGRDRVVIEEYSSGVSRRLPDAQMDVFSVEKLAAAPMEAFSIERLAAEPMEAFSVERLAAEPADSERESLWSPSLFAQSHLNMQTQKGQEALSERLSQFARS